jgi:hypothetical protein
MADLLAAYGLSDRMVSDSETAASASSKPDATRLKADIDNSREFLKSI